MRPQSGPGQPSAQPSSDRLFLEEANPLLKETLLKEPTWLAGQLLKNPEARVLSQDLQEFEVGVVIASEGEEILLQVNFSFLAGVWNSGSKLLLEQVTAGLPVRGTSLDLESGTLVLALQARQLAEDDGLRERTADVLSKIRTWLFIGPLMQCLRWLRDAVAKGDEAATRAVPGNAKATAAAAIGTPPGVVTFQVRKLETVWIVTKPDRVLVIVSVSLEDEVDTALGRAFCQEFAETNRTNTDVVAPPCSFNEAKDPPADLKSLPQLELPNVGFLTLTLSDQMVRGTSDERLVAMARPVMTWRNFFHFHLKHTKSYLHSRLRRRLADWERQVQGTRRQKKDGAERVRRLANGKEFAPQPRASTGGGRLSAASQR